MIQLTLKTSGFSGLCIFFRANGTFDALEGSGALPSGYIFGFEIGDEPGKYLAASSLGSTLIELIEPGPEEEEEEEEGGEEDEEEESEEEEDEYIGWASISGSYNDLTYRISHVPTLDSTAAVEVETVEPALEENEYFTTSTAQLGGSTIRDAMPVSFIVEFPTCYLAGPIYDPDFVFDGESLPSGRYGVVRIDKGDFSHEKIYIDDSVDNQEPTYSLEALLCSVAFGGAAFFLKKFDDNTNNRVFYIWEDGTTSSGSYDNDSMLQYVIDLGDNRIAGIESNGSSAEFDLSIYSYIPGVGLDGLDGTFELDDERNDILNYRTAYVPDEKLLYYERFDSGNRIVSTLDFSVSPPIRKWSTVLSPGNFDPAISGPPMAGQINPTTGNYWVMGVNTDNGHYMFLELDKDDGVVIDIVEGDEGTFDTYPRLIQVWETEENGPLFLIFSDNEDTPFVTVYDGDGARITRASVSQALGQDGDLDRIYVKDGAGNVYFWWYDEGESFMFLGRVTATGARNYWFVPSLYHQPAFSEPISLVFSGDRVVGIAGDPPTKVVFTEFLFA